MLPRATEKLVELDDRKITRYHPLSFQRLTKDLKKNDWRLSSKIAEDLANDSGIKSLKKNILSMNNGIAIAIYYSPTATRILPQNDPSRNKFAILILGGFLPRQKPFSGILAPSPLDRNCLEEITKTSRVLHHWIMMKDGCINQDQDTIKVPKIPFKLLEPCRQSNEFLPTHEEIFILSFNNFARGIWRPFNAFGKENFPAPSELEVFSFCENVHKLVTNRITNTQGAKVPLTNATPAISPIDHLPSAGDLLGPLDDLVNVDLFGKRVILQMPKRLEEAISNLGVSYPSISCKRNFGSIKNTFKRVASANAELIVAHYSKLENLKQSHSIALQTAENRVLEKEQEIKEIREEFQAFKTKIALAKKRSMKRHRANVAEKKKKEQQDNALMRKTKLKEGITKMTGKMSRPSGMNMGVRKGQGPPSSCYSKELQPLTYLPMTDGQNTTANGNNPGATTIGSYGHTATPLPSPLMNYQNQPHYTFYQYPTLPLYAAPNQSAHMTYEQLSNINHSGLEDGVSIDGGLRK